jgi:hypothetical protein
MRHARYRALTAISLVTTYLAAQGCSAASNASAPGTDDAGLHVGDSEGGSGADDASDDAKGGGGPTKGDSGEGADGGSPSRDAGPSRIPDAANPMDGDTTACPAAAEGGVTLSAGTPSARAVVPNPIVSLGKSATTTTSGYDASQLFDDPADPSNMSNLYGVAWQPSPGESVTIDVGSGPTELLMVWEVNYPDYLAQGSGFGLPYDYAIDVSADGSTWTRAVPQTTSNTRSREVKFAFSGNRYVRFTLLTTTSGDNTMFTSVKIFDVSNGSEDTWLVAGMGPSRFVYNDLQAPGFGHLVNSCRPKYYPAIINISDLSGSIADFLNAVKAPAGTNWLSLNPDFHFWILTYGLGDLGGSASDFSSNLESAVQLLLAAGRVPVLTHIQYVAPSNGGNIDPASIPPFNTAVDALVAKYGLLPSPDLYAWFEAHPSELCTSADDANDPSGFCGESAWDGIEPTNLPSRTGVSDTIRLWAAAASAGGVYAE